jgi:hypothetical protein
MKTIILTFLSVIVLDSPLLAQQRMGIDVSSRLTDITLSTNYQKVVKKNFLISGGLTFGSLGRKFIDFDNDTTLLKNGFIIQSPYANVSTSFRGTDGNYYQLTRYNMNSKGIGISLGLGVFKEFSVNHGIRFNLNSKFYVVNSRIHTGYFNSENSFFSYLIYHQNYFVGSISPEVYHTIRLSGRSTLYYGIKLPYYFSLDKGKFRPTNSNELLAGFEADLSVGLTYVIGKCD